MAGINQVRPNIETHPEFGQAMQEAVDADVQILFLECNFLEYNVTEDSLEIIS